MCACVRFYNSKMLFSGEIGTLDVQDTPKAFKLFGDELRMPQ